MKHTMKSVDGLMSRIALTTGFMKYIPENMITEIYAIGKPTNLERNGGGSVTTWIPGDTGIVLHD